MKHLGVYSHSTDLEFPLTAKDSGDFMELSLSAAEDRYACVHPGSRGTWRQWPPEHFASLADYCYEQGFKIVLTGTRDEKPLTEKVQSLMKHPALNLAGKSSLGAMGVLVNKAALLISNCTGVSHMAAALKTPSIVISMDGEPERWGPLDTSIHRTINWLTLPDFKSVVKETSSLIKTIKERGQPESAKAS
jgi:ADP-heptose:LPS heptosyltransferase